MLRPKFWQKRWNLWSLLLLPVSFIYGLVVSLRLKRTPTFARIKVICVGNFIAGGAGKTPTALYVAGQLKALGHNPFFVMRGFGGAITTTTRVRNKRHTALDVGDEALMLSRTFPTIIGKDKVAAVALAAKLGASCAVLDDGLQNPSLHKDLSLLVVDSYGLGNGRLLPSGPLREKPQAALARADVLVSIGSTRSAVPPHSLPVLEGGLVPRTEKPLPRGKFVAFAGIGFPEKFWRTLDNLGAQAGIQIVARHAYGDHYFYQEKDGAFLLQQAADLDAHLITTEKDKARLMGTSNPSLLALLEKTYTLPVELKITQGESDLLEKLKATMKKRIPEEKPSALRSLFHFLELLGVGVFYFMAQILGLDLSSRLGGWLGERLGPKLSRHQLALENITTAMPELSAGERDAILKKMWHNMGRTFFEYPHLNKFQKPKYRDRIEVFYFPRTKKILEERKGKGMFFLSGHFTNWELLPLVARFEKLEAVEIYQPLTNPMINFLLKRLRLKAICSHQVEKKQAVRDIIRHIKVRRIFMALVDQKMRSGTWNGFFNLPAQTSTFAATMAVKHDYILVPSQIERIGDGKKVRFRIVFNPPLVQEKIEQQTKDIVHYFSHQVNHCLEVMIREQPENWLWFHHRWSARTK